MNPAVIPPCPCTRDQARQMLLSKGVRPTHHREGIYATLCASTSHPSAEEIHSTIKRSEPGISLATVYNTLEVLTRAGLCRKLAPSVAGSSSARFDADMSDHVHILKSDGTIIDIPHELRAQVLDAIPKPLLERIQQLTGIPIARVSIELFEECSPSSPVGN